jgi:putative tryptophan/tyrosine transport system substrate-binding protein
MRRREFIAFITLIGGAAATCPMAARAQQSAMPVIGLLLSGTAADGGLAHVLAGFRAGLGETGYVEGKNVVIEYRWAQGKSEVLPELAAALARRRVTVIAAPGSVLAALAAKRATTTIPIVFNTGADPVEIGLVASLNRPGGNITGVSYMNTELAAKRLGMLHELLPKAARFAVLVERNNPSNDAMVADLRAAAASIGRDIEVAAAATGTDIIPALTSLVQKRVDALLTSPAQLLYDRRVQLLALAARYTLPVIYPSREWAEAGGLMSYGSSFTDQNRQAGIYTGRVLKGEKPANLPILRATRFELVINMQIANALGIDVPGSLLARADEAIE